MRFDMKKVFIDEIRDIFHLISKVELSSTHMSNPGCENFFESLTLDESREQEFC